MNSAPTSNPAPARRDRDIIGPTVAELIVLLLVPAAALYRLAGWMDWRVLAGGPILISTVVYFLYRMDKRRAGGTEWRVPEAILHCGEFIGGWPGALLAQRIFRHKTAKVSYQLVFWGIVLLHQTAALGLLLNWKLPGTTAP